MLLLNQQGEFKKLNPKITLIWWYLTWKHCRLETKKVHRKYGNDTLYWKHCIGNKKRRIETIIWYWKYNLQIGNICFPTQIFKSELSSPMFPISSNCFETTHCVSNRISLFSKYFTVSQLNVSNILISFPIDLYVSGRQCFQFMFPNFLF